MIKTTMYVFTRCIVEFLRVNIMGPLPKTKSSNKQIDLLIDKPGDAHTGR